MLVFSPRFVASYILVLQKNNEIQWNSFFIVAISGIRVVGSSWKKSKKTNKRYDWIKPNYVYYQRTQFSVQIQRIMKYDEKISKKYINKIFIDLVVDKSNFKFLGYSLTKDVRRLDRIMKEIKEFKSRCQW